MEIVHKQWECIYCILLQLKQNFFSSQSLNNKLRNYIYTWWAAPGNLESDLVKAVWRGKGWPLEQSTWCQCQGCVGVTVAPRTTLLPPFVFLCSSEVVQPEEIHRHSVWGSASQYFVREWSWRTRNCRWEFFIWRSITLFANWWNKFK